MFKKRKIESLEKKLIHWKIKMDVWCNIKPTNAYVIDQQIEAKTKVAEIEYELNKLRGE